MIIGYFMHYRIPSGYFHRYVQLVCSLPSRGTTLRFPQGTGTPTLALQVTSYSALHTWMVTGIVYGGGETFAEAIYLPSGDQASLSIGEAFLVKV